MKKIEKIRIFLKKSWKIILCFLMIMSTIAITGGNSNIKDVIAYNGYPKNTIINYHGKLTYGGTTAGNFTIGGKQAFCMAHELPTPASNTKMTASVYDNANIKKVLYYGWSGPEQWSGFKSKAQGVVVTSLALSHYYNGTKERAIQKDFMNYIKSKTVPDYYVKFSTSSVTAYVSGSIQRTPSVTLNSGMTKNSVSVTLQSDVTYVDETHNKRQKGGTVKIYGKTRFHLEAPLTKDYGTWSTGSKSQGAAPAAIINQAKVGKVQPTGYPDYVIDPERTTSLKVKWIDLGSLKLGKQEKETGKMVADTYFKVSYNSDMSNYKGIWKTGKDGYVTVNNLRAGTVYVQEIKVPDHLILDKTIRKVIIEKGKTVSFTNKNNLKPTSLKLGKQELETGKMVAGALFKVSQKPDMSNYRGIYKTGSDGYVTLSNLLPGTYYVQEVGVPAHLILDKTIHKVTVTYDKPGTFIKKNNLRKGNLKLGKQDEKKRMVPNTLFKVSQKSDMSNYRGIYKTGNDGYVTLSNLLPGTYYVQEMSVPNHLILDKTIHKVVVNYDKTTTFIKTNKIKPARLDIFKTGEVLTDYKDGNFVFEEKGLPDMEVQIFAEEKIFDYITGKTYQKGDLVKTVKTGKDGKISVNLPLGKYRLHESKAPLGFVLSSVDQYVTLSSSSPTQTLVTASKSFYNERQKVKINAIKVDGMTQERLENAVIGMYANEDIYNYQGKKIVNKDTLLLSKTTDKNGNIVFDIDLPLVNVYLEELEAPLGYTKLDKKYYIDIKSTDQTTQIYNFTRTIINNPKEVEISKKAITGEEELPGAKLQLIDAVTKEVVEEWISTDKPHMTNELLVGKSYILREILSPDGYTIANDIEFTVNGDNSVQKVTMLDELTRVEISKQDATTGKELPGAKLEIIDPITNKVVKEHISTSEPWIVEGLIWNKEYILRETLAPDGYDVANEIRFTVGKNEKVVMKDEITKTLISKRSSLLPGELAGAELQIIDPVTNEIVREHITTDKEWIVERLILNKEYILREVKAPENHSIAEDIHFTVGKDKEVVMIDDYWENEELGDEPVFKNPTIKTVKTGDMNYVAGFVVLALISFLGIIIVKKKKN